jgi:hypothetical protein
MKFVVIIALSLAALSLAAPSTQPRQVGTNDGDPGGTFCSSPCPIEYGLDHLIGISFAHENPIQPVTNDADAVIDVDGIDPGAAG